MLDQLTGRSLKGRVVVLTGATAGIGRATALRLAGAGATVVASARNEVALRQLASEADGIVPRRCDVSDDDDRAHLIAATLADQGRIDVLVDNVGIGLACMVEDMTVEQIRSMIETNLVGAIDLVRLVLPHMLARGDGDIVLTASGASWFATPPLTVYSATKYGLAGFAEGLRREVRTRGIRVHTIHPALVSTEFTARAGGAVPGEVDGTPAPGPGIPPEWVAAAIERSVRRPWSRTAAVPRVLGLTRVLQLPPLSALVDVVLAANARGLTDVSRSVARDAAAAGNAEVR
jgi:NAD(P)-dependent dehydrogenase (short-subunit alcohol dehydrogenase family)